MVVQHIYSVRKANTSNLFSVNMTINGKQQKVTVDTAASRSLISAELVQGLTLTPSRHGLWSASDDELKLMGECKIICEAEGQRFEHDMIVHNQKAQALTVLLGNDFHECQVCCDVFNGSENVPKVLPCGHTYCVICLFACQPRKCPLCRMVSFPSSFQVLSCERHAMNSLILDFFYQEFTNPSRLPTTVHVEQAIKKQHGEEKRVERQDRSQENQPRGGHQGGYGGRGGRFQRRLPWQWWFPTIRPPAGLPAAKLRATASPIHASNGIHASSPTANVCSNAAYVLPTGQQCSTVGYNGVPTKPFV